MTGKTRNRIYIRRAVKGRGFLAPHFSAPVRRFMIIVSGIYLRFVEGVSKVSFIHEERIIDAIKGFYNGEHRLVFVFRHAAKEDPSVLMYSFNNALRRKIEKGRNLSHVRFLYGRDVPNWAGKITIWLFPRIGAIPVQNRSSNRQALHILRSEMKNGRFPVILAPEEQIVYHMYRTFEIAPGISSLVRWGLESGKPVAVVPLSLGYSYGPDPEAFIRNKLSLWEDLTGFRLENRESGKLHDLLIDAANKTISVIEPLCGIPAPQKTEKPGPAEIDERIKHLCDALLAAAEKAAGLPPDGTAMDRLFRVRYAGSDAFYPEKTDPASLPPLQRALLDFNAMKAEVSIRYERIFDVLEYIHTSYIDPPFSAGRGCEFVLNLLDVVNRASGGDISRHNTPSGQHAVILAGEPMVFNDASHKGMSRREFLDLIKSDVKDALQKTSGELEPIWEKVKLE